MVSRPIGLVSMSLTDVLGQEVKQNILSLGENVLEHILEPRQVWGIIIIDYDPMIALLLLVIIFTSNTCSAPDTRHGFG